jgi:hypothetical protein
MNKLYGSEDHGHNHHHLIHGTNVFLISFWRILLRENRENDVWLFYSFISKTFHINENRWTLQAYLSINSTEFSNLKLKKNTDKYFEYSFLYYLGNKTKAALFSHKINPIQWNSIKSRTNFYGSLSTLNKMTVVCLIVLFFDKTPTWPTTPFCPEKRIGGCVELNYLLNWWVPF